MDVLDVIAQLCSTAESDALTGIDGPEEVQFTDAELKHGARMARHLTTRFADLAAVLVPRSHQHLTRASVLERYRRDRRGEKKT